MKKVLILEDEVSIRSFVVINLKRAGYEAIEAGTGREALERLKENPDTGVAILDIMLPDIDGFEVCRSIRATNKAIGIIMLTARTQEMDKVTGLMTGADDYVTKPFEVKELIARIHAVMRRADGVAAPAEKKLVYDKLVVNLDSYELIVDGKKIDTPPKEMELLYHLAASPNRVFTRNQLLDEGWGFDYFGDSRTVDVHIQRLREKLEGVSDQWSLKTVWGVGYKFEVNENPADTAK